MTLNVQRLKDYKARLVVFPRHNNKIKNGDATKAEIAASTLDTSSVNTLPKAAAAVTFAPITEVFKKTFMSCYYDNWLFREVCPSRTDIYSINLIFRSSRLSRHTVLSDLPVQIPALLVSAPRSPRKARRMPQQRKSKQSSSDFVSFPLTFKKTRFKIISSSLIPSSSISHFSV